MSGAPTTTATAEGRVAELAADRAARLGLAVLDVVVAGGVDPVVQVTVDVAVPDAGRLEPGAAPVAVDIDAIATLSRELDVALAAAAAVPAGATLEVSSPGVDRPLRDARDFVRNLGREVEVELRPAADGEGEGVRVRGRVVEVVAGRVVLASGRRGGRPDDGESRSVALGDVVAALPVLPW